MGCRLGTKVMGTGWLRGGVNCDEERTLTTGKLCFSSPQHTEQGTFRLQIRRGHVYPGETVS